MTDAVTLTPALASSLAQLTLSHVECEFPNALHHVLNDAADVKGPGALHPIFYGSGDWHTCVQGYWLLATLLRRYPRLAEAPHIHALFERQFTDGHVAAELHYLGAANRGGFERPYGWAWLLMLAAELRRHAGADARRWGTLLKPLTNAFVARFTAFLPKAAYPTRAGSHANSSFAIALAIEYADTVNDKRLARLLRGRAIAWFAKDTDCQAWEPGGEDFLSTALMEAECMRRSMEPADFGSWFARFLPGLGARVPATLFTPASASDGTGGRIARVDGLNLSRAWCWRSLATAMTGDDPRGALMVETADAHVRTSFRHIAGAQAAEHWLAAFGLLALGA